MTFGLTAALIGATIVTTKANGESRLIVSAAQSINEWIIEFETAIEPFADRISKLFLETFKFSTAELPQVQFVYGEASAIVGEHNHWLVGASTANLIGSQQDDVLIHFGFGKAYAGPGDDWLLAWKPDYIFAGDPLDPG